MASKNLAMLELLMRSSALFASFALFAALDITDIDLLDSIGIPVGGGIELATGRALPDRDPRRSAAIQSRRIPNEYKLPFGKCFQNWGMKIVLLRIFPSSYPCIDRQCSAMFRLTSSKPTRRM